MSESTKMFLAWREEVHGKTLYHPARPANGSASLSAHDNITLGSGSEPALPEVGAVLTHCPADLEHVKFAPPISIC